MLDFPRPKRPILALDMAPLIDVVFLLLVFFLLTSSFRSPSLPLDLPGLANQEITPAEPITVSLDAQGRLALNGEILPEAALREALSALLAADSHRTVHFRGDHSIPYGRFLQWMQIAREAGAVRLHLVHQKE